MSVESEKLERFERIVFSEVDEQIKNELQCANVDKEKMFEELNDQVLYDVYEKIRAQIKRIQNDYVRKAAQYELDAKRAVLKYREDLAKSLFKSISEKLAAFVSGPDYVDNLKQKLIGAFAEHNTKGAVVYLRSEDIALFEQLQSAVDTPFEVRPEPKIKLGGLVVYFPEEAVAMDMTLDAALESEQRAFVASGELKIS